MVYATIITVNNYKHSLLALLLEGTNKASLAMESRLFQNCDKKHIEAIEIQPESIEIKSIKLIAGLNRVNPS